MIKLFETIRKHVANTPEKVILSAMGEGRDVPFRELDQLSGKIYRYLKERGIGREDFVNILLPRGVDPFIAMLGVWKAGAAFVVLEEDYPSERIAFIQKDCGCRLILDRAAWAEAMQCEPLAGYAEVNDHDAAFAVYTSGTTGAPKGVLHEYGNLDLIAKSVYLNGESVINPKNHFAMIAPLYFIVVILAYVGILDAGVRMSVVPFHITKNPPALAKAFMENSVDSVFCAPSIYRLFRKIPTLRKYFLGSEPANGIWSDDPELLIYNGYCMSETAFCVTMGLLNSPNEIAPIGKPLTGLKVTLRDTNGRPVADGEEGELCVENPYVRGYINLPEETAKAFVDGEFHTRDMARSLPDGGYEVLGRIDDMIKISGNRVEPAEIEAAVSRVTGLQQVVVRGFGEGEDAFICLYYADPVELNAEELREKLGAVLPYYMIPSHFIHLDALPRTATGKISRRLLPKPAEERQEYVAPENDTARALCEAMASVLKLDRFSAEEDFYRMGGSSVSSMEVVSLCNLPGLTIGQIFRGRTPNKIAEYYLAERTVEETPAAGENLAHPCPLSQSQLGIFLECEKRAGEAAYNNPMLFRLPDDLEPDRLVAALEKMVKAHPGLFAAVVTDDQGLPAMRYQREYEALEICPRERMTGEELRANKSALVQPFDLRHDRLFRIRLIETESARYLFMDFHHIVFDGTSLQILLSDLEKALEGETVPPETWTAFDAMAAEQRARENRSAWEKAKGWYLDQFGGTDPTSLPEGDAKDQEARFGDQSFELELSYGALKAFCEKRKTTENVLTTAAFGYLLSSYVQKQDVLFATVYNGRRDPRTKRTVSMFVTTLPVLCRTGGKRPVAEVLSDLKEQLLGSMANDLYSFAELAADTGITGEIQFAWQAELLSLPKESRLRLTREDLPFIATGEAISAQLFPQEDRLILHLQYRLDRYSDGYMADFARCFGHVLREMTEKDTLGEIGLLSVPEREKILSLSRGESMPYDTTETWLDLFLRHARKSPDRTAVTDCGGSFTYAELDKVSDRLAAYLLQNGVEENTFVAVKTGRVKEFIAAVIGIQKAGAAYVPVDPEYPEDRVAYMLEDSEAKVILTEETIAQALEQTPDAESLNRAIPAHRAYMIYTSGSTGKPKGVVQSHRSLRAFTEWRMNAIGIHADSVHAVHASFSFDASLDDLICPLAAGGEIHILSEELRRDMEGMRDYFQTRHISALTLPTQMGMAMVNQYPDMALGYVMMGGEKMLPCAKTKIRLINGYGPTEFTVCSSWHEVDQEKDTGNIPIGRPVANTWSVICDQRGNLMPRGVVGELCLAGPQIAEGYWKRKEQTEERFVPCPFPGATDGKMYRTGDLARYNGEGELEFFGRIDTQVKLRGFRIELGEIESTAVRYEGVTQAAAEVIGDQLALFFTAEKEIDPKALRAFLAGSLTAYMVPSVFRQLEEMPLTPGGKVDRKALRATPLDTEEIVDLPENETEQKLSDLVREVIGRQIGVTAELETEGLNSLGALRLIAMISKKFGRNLKLADLKEHGTIRALAGGIASAGEEERFDRRDRYPLSTAQQGVYVECLSNPGTTVYNEPALLKLDRDVDIDRLKQAIIQAVDAHPYLKTRLSPAENGEIMACRRDDDRQVVEEIEFTSLEQGFAGLVRPFHLTEDSLFRTAIIHDGEDHYLFLDGHHIVVDGESLHIILRDLNQAYAGKTPGKESFTGFEAALLEEKLRRSPRYEKAKEYYTGLLDGIEMDCLPVIDRDQDRPEVGSLTVKASPDRDCLSGAVRDGTVTLNGLWNAAFGFALSAFLYRRESVYTTVYNGRNDPRLAESVGMFVHTLPVVCRPENDESGLAFAKRIGQQLRDSMANDIFSFAEISRQLDMKANILFVYQGSMMADPVVGGRQAKAIPLPLNALKATLTIFVTDAEDGFELSCDYDADHYEEWSVRALLEAAASAFDQLIRNRKISEISLISPEEQRKLDEYNRTEKEVENTEIVTLFRRAAKAMPDRTAVIFRDRVLSYRELDAVTDRIAAFLQQKGIGAEDVVSILIPRSEYMPVTALGALKAGAAYQPLDPGYPVERLKLMIEDSAPKALIVEESLRGLLPDYTGEVLYLHEIEQLPEAKPRDPEITSDSLFILLYTSGTTGKPKGVMLTHGNLVNFCQWYVDRIDLTEQSIAAAYASFGFDVCMLDLYPTLVTGAAVCIVPEDLRLNLPELNAYFKKHGVTHAFMTTQMARIFATTVPDISVKHLLCGGEKLAPFTPEGTFRFYNGYGPTECTILATIFELKESALRIPIGWPLSNYKLYVVGPDGRELPTGAVGELWIAGLGVARGYLNKPEQTAKAFLRNPFCDAPGFDRVYRTGDIVRRLPDGSIDFIGRNDGQVKIRGFRIELSEVEGVLLQYEGIKEAVVQAFDDPAGGKFLAAYFVSDQEIDLEKLTEFIKSRKPAYMVPSTFTRLEKIPLNQNHKVDRKKLPPPERQDTRSAYVEPATPLEKELCEAFAKILGRTRVSAVDDFFEIGGTSITAASLLTYALGKGYRIVFKDIFDNPTPRKLAGVIEGSDRLERSKQASDYDYREIDRFIAYNSLENIDEIRAEAPNDIILTGATGFLGIHVLRHFLENARGKVFCLMRSHKPDNVEDTLKSLLMYYFGKPYMEQFGKRVFCVEGDLTDTESLKALDHVKADMIINCAANVKHFVKDDILDRVNFHGVENLIEVCLRNHMKLVQISTLSVGGSMAAHQAVTLFENNLYFNQYVDNDYVRTKFLAERAVLEARVKRGLDAVILRAGNLMGRYSDGEFQINLLTNAFMRSLAAFNHIGACPVTALASPVEFSPIDATAGAVLALAGVNTRFSIFHICNNHTVTMGDIVFALKQHGMNIRIVTEREFVGIMREASTKDSYSEAVTSLVAYEERGGENIIQTENNNYFTINALYRLGFRWPIVDEAYLEKVISGVESLEFFNRI